MKTVTEDYVSFEVAKLLKEKGFNVAIHTFYNPNKSCTLIKFDSCLINRNAGVSISAPTHQMVMKWLREEKDVLITYDLAGPFGSKLLVKVYKKDYDLDWIEATTIIRKTLEEAIDTAIQWYLENLI